jgi:signal transduction histidine kinase
MDPQMRILSGLKDQPLAEIDLFQLLEKFKTETFNEPNLALRKILQTGETYENELFFENTGKTLKIQINLVEAFFDNETSSVKKPACFLVVIDDITVIKENEKLRSDMVNLMSHEIRTPITSIQGFAELLLADETIDSEKKEFLSIIAKESQRLSRMLTTFLSIAKLEQSDKKEFQKIPVKIDYIVSEVVREMQEKAKRKRIRLVEKSDSHLPPIAADKGLITKAIMHLVDNAIKYSPERTSVIISTALETEYLRVTVEDRGYGIPKDEQEKIWQKFYRIAREGQDKEEESTGLGLALVKEIVEKHGGQVEVESEVGFGSKFTVRLPRL